MSEKLYILILIALLLILDGCQEKKVYPEVTQLRIVNRGFLEMCREVLTAAETYNLSLDSTSVNYDEEKKNVFVIDVFKQVYEEKTDTFFQFVMINEIDVNPNNKYYGYFILCDRPFFVFPEVEESLLDLMFEKLPFKNKFQYLYYSQDSKKDKSNLVVPILDIKYRTYKYVNGEMRLFRDMY